MSVVTPHQTDLTTSCKFKRDHRLRRALHLLLNHNSNIGMEDSGQSYESSDLVEV
jgi:hypothetical protein